MRLRVMFLAMCKYYDLKPESIQKPFNDSEPLYLYEDVAENCEVESEDASVIGINEGNSENSDEYSPIEANYGVDDLSNNEVTSNGR